MFDSITIKTNDPSNSLDIGYLAECLLFYNKTNLLIDKDNLSNLFKACGVDEIYELIKRGNLSIQTKANILGAGKKGDTYFVDLLSPTSVDKHYQTFYEAFFNLYEKQGKARRSTLKFIQESSPYKYDNKVLKDIKESIGDKLYIKQIINNFIIELGLENEFIGKEWYYDYVPVNDYSFNHITNLDLDKLKKLSEQKKLHFDFSATSLLLNLSESFGDIYIAENNNSEISSTPVSSKIINLKFDNIFQKTNISKKDIAQFQKIALPNYKDLSSVINTGEKSFKELIHLIDKADKFKKWKSELDSETSFIEEYSKAISKESWLDKLPSKIGRFSTFQGLGLLIDLLGAGGIGTASAVALNTGDAFLLDKILKKWKPNQFIKGHYKGFVK